MDNMFGYYGYSEIDNRFPEMDNRSPEMDNKSPDKYDRFPEMNLSFPEMYHRLYPKVHDCVTRHIREKGMDYEPNDREIESMTDDIYRRMIIEYPEIDRDEEEERFRFSMSTDVESMQRRFFGRRRLFRDLITIVLLGTFFGRRRRRRGFF